MSNDLSVHNYLDFWQQYGKQEIDWANNLPRDRTDFRERVRRETLRGKLTFFHESIEMYLQRQMKAYTTTRCVIAWFASYYFAARCAHSLYYTFPDLPKYGLYWNHPNWKKMGTISSLYHILKFPLSLWILFRLSKMLYRRVRDQWDGKEDILATLQYDWYYEDFYKDVNDMRAVNFRYGDHRDRIPYVREMSHDLFKPEADKTKQALKFYKRGEDSFFQWFFKYFY